ncbi:ABC transporter substrate-binding protein [Azoarcus communis]|uniref:ABC transporter substrate-binding protein n=2 Tax=Parazoarcus communis TaxID=41977 RepID=A0A323UTD9_9RHOO|nr:ABC transporter substrate-binding protein [Parazoarcus communis SWub3 = DSM 12120]PZA16302.1 ABC transporter substrate-binding protein [Azoarcus communis] [Parazoarcus communis SWub3 = DSM 12120]
MVQLASGTQFGAHWVRVLALVLGLWTLVGTTQAAALKIGLAAEVTTVDPHFFNTGPNNAFLHHVFDSLVDVDADGRLISGLAESWVAVDATTWEFRLRKGVKFHDGSELSAEDVLFSLARPAQLTNSPGSYTSYTKPIVASQAVDRYTVRLRTATPYGPLPLDLSSIFIVSKKAVEKTGTEQFNAGPAAIGTGPFRLVAFHKGERIELARHEAYWGVRPEWDTVHFRVLASDAPRLSALLAGDVDLIEAVPTADLARLKTNPRVSVTTRTTWRTLFWHLDQFRDRSPYVTDLAGKPLDRNPLKDVRVRRAISKAINRQALVERSLEGRAVAASNINAPGIFGYNSEIAVEAYDPAGAKKLLAEAGYPEGFGLTLHGPNNRYINDAQVVQTVAQLLNRVGIRAKVETLPLSVYFGKARASEYSMALLGWGSLASDFTLRSIVGTPDADRGWGTWNWGRYSNPAVDALVQSALESVSPEQREDFARQAAKLALDDVAVIPSHHQLASWGLRKGLKYDGRVDEFTYAHEVRSVK